MPNAWPFHIDPEGPNVLLSTLYAPIRVNSPNPSPKNHEICRLDPNLCNQLLGPHFASDRNRALSESTTRDQNKFEWHAQFAISRLYFASNIVAPSSVNQSGIARLRRRNFQQQAWNGNLAFARSCLFNRGCHVVIFAQPVHRQTEVVSNLSERLASLQLVRPTSC